MPRNMACQTASSRHLVVRSQGDAYAVTVCVGMWAVRARPKREFQYVHVTARIGLAIIALIKNSELLMQSRHIDNFASFKIKKNRQKF